MNRSYYKYDFVSPEPIFAKIKEELRSYFATGAIDDILFPTWVDECMRHLGKASFPIVPTVIEIDDFTGKLPTNFLKAREVWACAPVRDVKYTQPSATYTQITTKLSDPCEENPCPTDDCNPCTNADLITVIYKTKDSARYTFNKQWLLRPGNIATRKLCADDCFNLSSSTMDTFDIHGDKLVTSFRSGNVYILYYSSSDDDCGNQLIPDNYRIQAYVEAFIKYKLFEQLYNQATDETARQMESKLARYQQASEHAYVEMDIESKKQTTGQKFDSINRTKRRNLQFIIR